MQTSAPFGFRPNFHTSGSANPRQKYGSVATPPAKTLYTGQPVTIDINGDFQPAVVYGTPNEVAPVYAVFWGIQYADQNGAVKERPQFLAGQPTFNSAASGVNNGDPYATFVYPYVFQDPQMEFEVQANGPMQSTALGQTFDIDVTTIDNGNISGYSAVTLNNTPVPDQAGNWIVTELAELPNNTWGDPFTIVMVKFNRTTF